MSNDGETGRMETIGDECNATKARVAWRRDDIAIDLVTFLLMLWPLAINGAPFYSDDSSSYLRGGAFGFETGLSMLSEWWESIVGGPPVGSVVDGLSVAGPASDSSQAIVQTAIAEAGGVRSVIYSVLTYILRAPGSSLLALAIVQAGAVTVIISFLRRLILPGTALWTGMAIGAGVAFLTSAAWYAAYAMADIFAGVMVGGALILTVFFDRLGTPARILLVLLVAIGATTHDSHLPVALATLMAGAAAHFWLQRVPPRRLVKQSIWFVSPLVLAVVALFATSLLAFGETSLAPKRYPILLARSVADGPGAWHLRENCATERYAICEVLGSQPPRDIGDFLWGAEGVRNQASPEQMERIRAEEATIIRRAAMDYPLVQIGLSARNMVAQFFKLGLTGLPFGQTLVGTADPILTQTAPDRPGIKFAFEIVIYAGFFGSLALLLYFRREIRKVEFAAVAVALAGLLANAAVCGILSAVTDRYQGRVAWILSSLALLILLRVAFDRRRRSNNATA